MWRLNEITRVNAHPGLRPGWFRLGFRSIRGYIRRSLLYCRSYCMEESRLLTLHHAAQPVKCAKEISELKVNILCSKDVSEQQCGLSTPSRPSIEALDLCHKQWDTVPSILPWAEAPLWLEHPFYPTPKDVSCLLEDWISLGADTQFVTTKYSAQILIFGVDGEDYWLLRYLGLERWVMMPCCTNLAATVIHVMYLCSECCV